MLSPLLRLIPMVPMDGVVGLKEKRVNASSSLALSQSVEATHNMNRVADSVMLLNDAAGWHKNNVNDPAANTLNLSSAAAYSMERPRAVGNTLNLTQYVHIILEGFHESDTDRSKHEIEAGVDLSTGQPVYISSNNQAKTANATPAPPADYSVTNVIGLVLVGANTSNTATVLTEGSVELDDWTSIVGTANLVPGDQYFLDDASGKMSTTEPSGNGVVVVVVGRAMTTKKIDIEVGSRTISAPFLDGTASSNMNLTHNVSGVLTNPFAFISQWNTAEAGTSNSQQITLPLVSGGTYDFIVDWGDSSSDTITAWDDAAKTHTYNSSGNYTVTVRGTIEGWQFADGGDKLKISNVQQWGLLKLGGQQAFFGCSNLTCNATDTLNVATETNLNFTFGDCSSFNGDITNWNTASALTLSSLFNGATLFDQNIASWNTAAVTGMNNVFKDAAAFNQNISAWNTANVTNMSGMFQGAAAFNQNISAWNTANVVTMSFMFKDAAAFNQNIASWNTYKVVSLGATFSGATAFNQNIASWNTANVTGFTNLFNSCTSFDQPIGSWNTYKVTGTSGMFQGATAFDQDLSSWNTGNLVNAASMFNGATSIDQDFGGWDVTSATSLGAMFSGATLSTANYDSLLTGWDAQAVKNNVNFHGGSSTYSAGAPATARANLISTNNWTITDGGAA